MDGFSDIDGCIVGDVLVLGLGELVGDRVAVVGDHVGNSDVSDHVGNSDVISSSSGELSYVWRGKQYKDIRWRSIE